MDIPRFERTRGGKMSLTTKEMQEEFKKVLLYGYERGNSDTKLSAHELVQELTEKMQEVMGNLKRP